MCILMGKRVAVFLNSFPLVQRFFWLKVHKSTSLETMVLAVVFIKFTFRWLQAGLSDLKTPNN